MNKKRGGRSSISRGCWLKFGAVGALAVAAFGVSALAINREAPKSDGAAVVRLSPSATATPSAVPTAEALEKLTIQRPATGALNVFFIGDSLTGNLHASKESKGFRPLMVAALGQGGVVNERQGFTGGGKTGEIAGSVGLESDNALAVIELGTNDVVTTPIPEFKTAYTVLLDAIRAASPNVRLLCAGTGNNPADARAWNTVIEEECEARKGVFVPLGDLHMQRENRGPAGRTDVFGAPSDDFHPNDKGYAAIAARLLERIDAVG